MKYINKKIHVERFRVIVTRDFLIKFYIAI